MTSFQDVVDESGITRRNFRMGLRGLTQIMLLYDDWRETIAAPEWKSSEIVSAQRDGGVLHFTLADGATMTIKLR